MGLNTIFLSMFGLMFVYASYVAWTTPIPITFNPMRSGLLVAEDVGKSKQIQSKTGDASMYVEKIRRGTIKSVGSANPLSIKETTYQLGSTTGAIETFLIGQNTA
jgi:hypothetical protein